MMIGVSGKIEKNFKLINVITVNAFNMTKEINHILMTKKNIQLPYYI